VILRRKRDKIETKIDIDKERVKDRWERAKTNMDRRIT
jgi:hypothetical protein